MDFYLRECLEKLYAQKADDDFENFLFYLTRKHGRIACQYSSGDFSEAEKMAEDLRRSVQLTSDETSVVPKNIRLSDLVNRLQERVRDINRRNRSRNKLRLGIMEIQDGRRLL